MADSVDITLRLSSLKDDLHQWVAESDALVVELEELANNLDEHFNNISKAKVGGAAGAVAGGLLAAAGFGLSFLTFGSSLGLIVVGGVIGGTGGLVVSGSQITDAVLSKLKSSSADKILQKYESRVESMLKKCVNIGTLLEGHGDVDTNFPLWVSFWSKIVMKSSTGIKIAWGVIGHTVATYLQLAARADHTAATAANITATAFKAIATPAGKAVHVAGGVLGILFLPLDIYTLVDSSIDVHQGNPHKTSKMIREMAAKMKTGRPTKADINKMVNETVAILDSLMQCR